MNTAQVIPLNTGDTFDSLVIKMERAKAIVSAMAVADENPESAIPPQHRSTLFSMLSELMTVK